MPSEDFDRGDGQVQELDFWAKVQVAVFTAAILLVIVNHAVGLGAGVYLTVGAVLAATAVVAQLLRGGYVD